MKKSMAELKEIRDRMKNQISSRETNDDADTRIVVGMATCGIAAGARPVLTAFMDEASKRNLQHTKITQCGCIGMCRFEPIVEVLAPNKQKVTYVFMTPEKVARVVNGTFGERKNRVRVHNHTTTNGGQLGL